MQIQQLAQTKAQWPRQSHQLVAALLSSQPLRGVLACLDSIVAFGGRPSPAQPSPAPPLDALLRRVVAPQHGELPSWFAPPCAPPCLWRYVASEGPHVAAPLPPPEQVEPLLLYVGVLPLYADARSQLRERLLLCVAALLSCSAPPYALPFREQDAASEEPPSAAPLLLPQPDGRLLSVGALLRPGEQLLCGGTPPPRGGYLPNACVPLLSWPALLCGLPCLWRCVASRWRLCSHLHHPQCPLWPPPPWLPQLRAPLGGAPPIQQLPSSLARWVRVVWLAPALWLAGRIGCDSGAHGTPFRF
mmetsp:Transcript_54960/g.96159  ORF Transcript_54960/g.96159 Transcript_54960/m.96159 type:complete len:302 (+) Transcript_54960:5303-6208(+)